MTGQPTREQWQWPRDAWQPPPVPPPGAPHLMVVPSSGPRRRSGKVWAVAAGGTVAVMAAVLAMCGSGSGDDVHVVAVPGATPSPSTASELWPIEPQAALPGATPAPSPQVAPVPEAARAGAVGEPSTLPVEVDTSGGPHPTTAAHPKPSHAARPGAAPGAGPNQGQVQGQGQAPHAGPAAAPPAAPAPSRGSGSTICDQAERVGRWPAGSEQARLCRSIYG